MSEDLEKRLAAAKAERAALEAARAARDAEKELLAQVEAEELAVRNERAIAGAEEEHGPIGVQIAVLGTRLGVVIVKRPKAALVRRFQDQGKSDYAAFEKLVAPCVVYPEKEAFAALLEELPVALSRLADLVIDLAGARAKEVSGKAES